MNDVLMITPKNFSHLLTPYSPLPIPHHLLPIPHPSVVFRESNDAELAGAPYLYYPALPR
jgi:hypothetical protein